MKKLLISSLFILLMSTNVMSREVVSFTVHYEDNKPIGHGNTRSPIEVPLVYIEDNILAFEAYHPDYVLNIMDENGDVVYSTTVFSTDTEVILPSTLSGDYEVNLIMGNWLFTGWINL